LQATAYSLDAVRWTEADTGQTIDARFRQQAAACPERAAIDGTGAVLGYADLDRLADGYAASLRARAERPRRIALLLRHGPDVVAAALGALRAGAAVVTLNPGDPPARIAAIREATDPDLVVTTAEDAEIARAAGFAGERVLDPAEVADGGPAAQPSPAGPDDPAFLICTSGSTGAPKVVVQTHRNVLHNVLRYTNGLGVREGEDRFALLAALSGGQGIVTTWSALLNGCTLCPFPIAERGVTGLGDWLEANSVTIFDTIPSVLRNFARTLHGRRIGGVRLVRLASEPALRSDLDAFRDHFGEDCRLASVLGSSECGIVAQAILDPDAEPAGERLPVGYAAEGVEVVLAGDEGEIVVRSRYLSPGYWGDDALTAAKFETVGGVRQFRSGDLGRLDAGGMLTVVGRADSQVKVRGNRLQLEEVEAALAAHPGVGTATVLATTTPRGDARLKAFLTAARTPAPTAAELRSALVPRLPAHAIPAAFVWLDALPVTPHGKVDRERLTALAEDDGARAETGALTQTEELLRDLWTDALEREDVGLDEGFLDLGGDSLDAAAIAAGIRDVFGVDLELGDFAENPSLATLAQAVESRRQTHQEPGRVALQPVPRRGDPPLPGPGSLSFAQLRFLRRAERWHSASLWNVVVPFRIRGPLDVEAFRSSVESLVRRHEILRTGYVERDGRRLAIVRPPEPVEIPVDDLRQNPDRERVAQEIAERERLEPFDLEHGPLLRLRLLRLGEEDYRLLRLTHHMIHDAASWTILFRELALEYEARLEGKESPFSEPPGLQYVDYAFWERRSQRPQSPPTQLEISYWARTYADSPDPPELPFARAKPVEDTDDPGVVRWGLLPEETERLAAIGRSAGATYFMTRLTAFAALLGLEAGVDDLLIGTPLNMRTRAELQTMVGPFINYRSLRLEVPGDAGFTDLITGVRRAVLDASRYSRLPWESLARELRSRGGQQKPVAASFAAWDSVTELRFGGLRLEALPRPCGDSPGFRVGVNRHYDADRCWADFDPRRFDPVLVEAFVGRLKAFLVAVAAEPSRPVHELRQSPTARQTGAVHR
jgi:non-ribosomal peptide synthetase component F/acyl carrier protein